MCEKPYETHNNGLYTYSVGNPILTMSQKKLNSVRITSENEVKAVWAPLIGKRVSYHPAADFMIHLDNDKSAVPASCTSFHSRLLLQAQGHVTATIFEATRAGVFSRSSGSKQCTSIEWTYSSLYTLQRVGSRPGLAAAEAAREVQLLPLATGGRERRKMQMPAAQSKRSRGGGQ